MATAVEEARAALLNIEQKFEQAMYDYGTEGFIETLADSLSFLPPEKQKEALATYPADLCKKVQAALSQLMAAKETRSVRSMRSQNYILSQTDLLTPEDYLQLEDKQLLLSAEDYEELYSEAQENNPWLAKKMSLLSPPIAPQLQQSPGESYALLQHLSFAEKHALYVFGAQPTKDWLMKNTSKNNQKYMLEEFARMGQAKKEDYAAALRIINEWSSKTERW